MANNEAGETGTALLDEDVSRLPFPAEHPPLHLEIADREASDFGRLDVAA
ncbi:MAG: hypothetical protein M3161_01385 [Actinomycetota bacterium]|nr:hypothetical protein [Actinomycetota bacterium]